MYERKTSQQKIFVLNYSEKKLYRIENTETATWEPVKRPNIFFIGAPEAEESVNVAAKMLEIILPGFSKDAEGPKGRATESSVNFNQDKYKQKETTPIICIAKFLPQKATFQKQFVNLLLYPCSGFK